MKTDIVGLEKVSPGVIVNVNRDGHSAYLQQRLIEQNKAQTVAGVQSQINTIRKDIDDIKDILVKLYAKVNE